MDASRRANPISQSQSERLASLTRAFPLVAPPLRVFLDSFQRQRRCGFQPSGCRAAATLGMRCISPSNLNEVADRPDSISRRVRSQSTTSSRLNSLTDRQPKVARRRCAPPDNLGLEYTTPLALGHMDGPTSPVANQFCPAS